MAYRFPNTPTQDPEFPDLAGTVNSAKPAASDDNVSTWPYQRYAHGGNTPALVMRPAGQTQDSSSMPSDDPLDVVRQQLQSIARSVRLLAAPWLTMPPDGESFHKPALGITIPAISVGVYSTVVSITVPPGRNGVLNEIANVYVGGGFTDYSGAVIWQIQRNPLSGLASAERNYEEITASLGTAAAPGKIAPIRLFENDVIVLAVTNVSIAPAGQIIGGLLGGWFYPRTWDDQFDRADQSLSW